MKRYASEKTILAATANVYAELKAKYPEMNVRIKKEYGYNLDQGLANDLGYSTAAIRHAEKVKFYSVRLFGCGTTSYMRDDGEYSDHPNCFTSFRIELDELKALTFAVVEKRVKDLAEIVAKGKILQAKENERLAKFKVEKAKEDQEKEKLLKRHVSSDEVTQRAHDAAQRVSASNEEKLEWYRNQKTDCGTIIVSDDYRKEFLDLISNEKFYSIVLDTLTLSAANFKEWSFQLSLRKETSKRSIHHFSIGGPIRALEYLTQDWK